MDTAPQNETPTWTIPAANIGALRDDFAQAAKRAAKLGVEAPQLIELEVIERPELESVDGPYGSHGGFRPTGRILTEYVVTVTGEAVRYAGWKLVGVIDRDLEEPESPNVVHAVEGEADPAWRTMAERCDHCGVDNRGRKTLVVVEHETEGRKVVGTTCLRDFLGHKSPEALADWATWVAELDMDEYADESFERGAHVEDRLDAATYLGWVVRSIHTSGWVPRSAAGWDRTATSDAAAGLFALNTGRMKLDRNEARPADLTEAELAEGTAAVEWAKTQGGNDYLDNIAAVALKTGLRSKDLGLAASIVSAYQRHLGREVELAVRAKATADSVHVGTIGERIELTGTCTFVRFFDGDYGTRALVKLLADGNVLTWWCSNAANAPEIGDTVTGKATVKEHDTYEGTAQTVITRAKLTKVEEA